MSHRVQEPNAPPPPPPEVDPVIVLWDGTGVTPDELELLLLEEEELDELLEEELLLDDEELLELELLLEELEPLRIVTVAAALVFDPPALDTTTVYEPASAAFAPATV